PNCCEPVSVNLWDLMAEVFGQFRDCGIEPNPSIVRLLFSLPPSFGCVLQNSLSGAPLSLVLVAQFASMHCSVSCCGDFTATPLRFRFGVAYHLLPLVLLTPGVLRTDLLITL